MGAVTNVHTKDLTITRILFKWNLSNPDTLGDKKGVVMTVYEGIPISGCLD